MKLVSTVPPPRDLDAELAAIDRLPCFPSLAAALTPAAVLFAFAIGWFLAALTNGGNP